MGSKMPLAKRSARDVIGRFFAKVVVDTINLRFLCHLQELALQRFSRLEVAAQRLLHNHPPQPASSSRGRLRRGCRQSSQRNPAPLHVVKVVAVRVVVFVTASGDRLISGIAPCLRNLRSSSTAAARTFQRSAVHALGCGNFLISSDISCGNRRWTCIARDADNGELAGKSSCAWRRL